MLNTQTAWFYPSVHSNLLRTKRNMQASVGPCCVAPPSRRTLHVSSHPLPAATNRGDRLKESGSCVAPPSRSTLQTFAWFLSAAWNKGVSPDGLSRGCFTPFKPRTRTSTLSTSPALEAAWMFFSANSQTCSTTNIFVVRDRSFFSLFISHPIRLLSTSAAR